MGKWPSVQITKEKSAKTLPISELNQKNYTSNSTRLMTNKAKKEEIREIHFCQKHI